MTTEEKARAYAEKAYYPAPEYGWYESDHEAMTDVLEQTYLAGASEALASQWVSVEERLPEYNTTCLVFGHETDFGDGRLARYTMMARYDGEDFYDVYNDRKYHPEMWMPIPSIPQLNPEKQSI